MLYELSGQEKSNEYGSEQTNKISVGGDICISFRDAKEIPVLTDTCPPHILNSKRGFAFIVL